MSRRNQYGPYNLAVNEILEYLQNSHVSNASAIVCDGDLGNQFKGAREELEKGGHTTKLLTAIGSIVERYYIVPPQDLGIDSWSAAYTALVSHLNKMAGEERSQHNRKIE